MPSASRAYAGSRPLSARSRRWPASSKRDQPASMPPTVTICAPRRTRSYPPASTSTRSLPVARSKRISFDPEHAQNRVRLDENVECRDAPTAARAPLRAEGATAHRPRSRRCASAVMTSRMCFRSHGSPDALVATVENRSTTAAPRPTAPLLQHRSREHRQPRAERLQLAVHTIAAARARRLRLGWLAAAAAAVEHAGGVEERVLRFAVQPQPRVARRELLRLRLDACAPAALDAPTANEPGGGDARLLEIGGHHDERRIGAYRRRQREVAFGASGE